MLNTNERLRLIKLINLAINDGHTSDKFDVDFLRSIEEKLKINMEQNQIVFDKLYIVWQLSDVKNLRPDLTEEQAQAVLNTVLQKHDNGVGVSWDTVSFWADELFPKVDNDRECFVGCECGCGKCQIYYQSEDCPRKDDVLRPACRHGETPCKLIENE